MGLGVVGPIDDLAGFAISRAFRVTGTRTNILPVECKGCGSRVLKGQGREVHVEGVRRGQTTAAYFCPQCFAVIWTANQRFPTLSQELMEEVRSGSYQDYALRRTAAELERLIEERERGAK